MSLIRKDPNSYVGDQFTLTFIKGDDNPLSIFNGEVGKLLGFKKLIKPFLNHELNSRITEPGYYEILGDPLLRLTNDKVIQVPFLNLSPIGYRLTDNIIKNKLYLQEKRKFVYVGHLPPIKYNIGDKVLVAHHGNYSDDFITEVLDIELKGTSAFYMVPFNDDILSVRNERIIDVIEYGELSEFERLGKLYHCTEKLTRNRLSRLRYQDDEHHNLPWE